MADDLAAEAWLAVARGLDRFEGDEPAFRGWLFTIARQPADRAPPAPRPPPHRTTAVTTASTAPSSGAWGGDPAWLVLEQLGVQQTVEMLVDRPRPRPGRGRAAARARRVRRDRGGPHHGPHAGQRPRACATGRSSAWRPR